MNTWMATKRQPGNLLASLAAILLAGVVLADPSAATAAQTTEGGGASAVTSTFDAADFIYMRKVAWAQDRVDRPWLYR